MNTILDRGDFVFKPPELGCVLSLSEIPGGSGKIYDRSPYGNIGSITGASWVRLPSGLWCLSFDGNDDYVNCGNASSLRVSKADFTFELWTQLNYTNGCSYERLLDKNQDDNNRWYFLLVPGGYPKLWFYVAATEPFNLQGVTAINDGIWHHLAVAKNGTKGYLYLDGSLDAESNCTDTDLSNTGNLSIGGIIGGASTIPGFIALPRIHNRALSVLEIQNHFDREKHLFGRW